MVLYYITMSWRRPLESNAESAPNTRETERRIFGSVLTDLVAKLAFWRRLESVWRAIEDEHRAERGLSLEEAAFRSGIDKNHLNTLLRKATGFTFHQLLVRYRLLRSIHLMRRRDYTLLEVSLRSGFGSLSSFERNFKKILGRTPRKFRRETIGSNRGEFPESAE